ncbi:MAG: hypothetical protein U9R58_00550 [Chloroflexota bacterium]|nr:hypothetical protein [Chloroflexota bacterium]
MIKLIWYILINDLADDVLNTKKIFFSSVVLLLSIFICSCGAAGINIDPELAAGTAAAETESVKARINYIVRATMDAYMSQMTADAMESSTPTLPAPTSTRIKSGIVESVSPTPLATATAQVSIEIPTNTPTLAEIIEEDLIYEAIDAGSMAISLADIETYAPCGDESRRYNYSGIEHMTPDDAVDLNLIIPAGFLDLGVISNSEDHKTNGRWNNDALMFLEFIFLFDSEDAAQDFIDAAVSEGVSPYGALFGEEEQENLIPLVEIPIPDIADYSKAFQHLDQDSYILFFRSNNIIFEIGHGIDKGAAHEPCMKPGPDTLIYFGLLIENRLRTIQ